LTQTQAKYRPRSHTPPAERTALHQKQTAPATHRHLYCRSAAVCKKLATKALPVNGRAMAAEVAGGRALPTSSSTLPIEIGDVTPANVMQLKTLNVSTLPVRYSEKFYKDLAASGNQRYMKFAYWNGFAVGGVCARIEPIACEGGEQQGEAASTTSKLYIMTINVLPAYRRRGIATRLLQHVLDEATKETTSTIVEVYLHVQTSNLEAKDFYVSHGFDEMGVVKDYYKRIDPPDAILLSRQLTKA